MSDPVAIIIFGKCLSLSGLCDLIVHIQRPDKTTDERTNRMLCNITAHSVAVDAEIKLIKIN